jgi:hypothetical protein
LRFDFLCPWIGLGDFVKNRLQCLGLDRKPRLERIDLGVVSTIKYASFGNPPVFSPAKNRG